MRWFVLLITVGLLAWLFAEVFLLPGIPAFRDAEHFYYPLFRLTGAEWAAGRVPLWNPYENLGAPLAANPTTSAFYPGILLFVAPLPSAVAYNIYLIGHLLLAAAGVYALARQGKASVAAAGLAGMAYAAGGSVLFQYTNAVFLVGAAWLPLALFAVEKMFSRRTFRWSATLGAILAMMVLGGDPQMAYHTGLLATLGAFFLRADTNRPPGPVHSRLAMLAFAGITGVVLSAVQVLPSLEYARSSERTVTPSPRSLYEVPRALVGDARGGSIADGLLCRRLAPGLHHENVYSHSFEPWRLAELIWPNAAGRLFPENHRWLSAIPAEGRVWVPSIYLGLLPAVLGLASLGWRRGDPRQRWLSWVLLLAVLASFGWYGPMGFVREASRWIGLDTRDWPASPVGGVYWWMTVALPGYIQFRYPAKWLVVASLALCLLAARGWDDAMDRPGRRLPAALAGLAGGSLALFALLLGTLSWWNPWLARTPANDTFGPLHPAGASADLLAALLHAAVLGGTVAWMLGPARNRFSPRRLSAALLLLTAFDLGWANRWMVVVTSDPARSRSPVAEAILSGAARSGREPGAPQARVYRPGYWIPSNWAKAGSPQRPSELVTWDRAVLWPKHHLQERIDVFPVGGTMMPRDLWCLVRMLDPVSRRAALDALSVTHAVLPGARRLSGARKLAVPGMPPDWNGEVSVWKNLHPRPRTWVVHQVQWMAPIEAVFPPGGPISPERLTERTRAVFAPGGTPRDFWREAVVEADRPPAGLQAKEGSARGDTVAESSARIVAEGMQRVEIEARLAQPGLVVLADPFAPGWHLTVTKAGSAPRSIPILRTNRLMRGVWLEPGTYRLVYRYRPASMILGAALSIAAWLALAALFLRRPAQG